VARVCARPSAHPIGRRFLYSGDDVSAAALCALLHRIGQPNPSAPWVIQHARQLTWTLADRSEPIRFLIRDRHQTFTDGFDDVFRSDGIEILRTPFRTPPANGVAERFVPTIRSECLDWISSEARTISSKCFASSLITTTATGLIEPWPSYHRNLCGCRLQIGAALVSSAAIDWAV